MILTDRDMPNVGGDELIEWMREVTPTTRIIMWSGNTNRTANMDADVFLTKPAPLQKLLGHIEALIPHCFEEVAPAAVQA
jgi:DNA-binding response OmpR family regulator